MPARIVRALALLCVLGLVACDTDPATEVSYGSAVLHGQAKCQNGSFTAPAQFELRKLGEEFAPVGPQHSFSCNNEPTVERDLPPTLVEELDWGTTYEFRLRVEESTYDSAGTENGTVYDSFTTETFPTRSVVSTDDLRDNIGMNTRLPFLGTPHGMCPEVKGALLYLGVKYFRDGLWPSWDASWDCLRDIAQTTDLKATLSISDMRWASRLVACDPPDGLPPRVPTAQELLQRYCASHPNHDVREFDPTHPNSNQSLAGILADLKADPEVLSLVDQFGSTNEPDLYTPFKNWAEVVRDYQEYLFNLRNDLVFAEIEVLGPSFAMGGAPQVGDVSENLDFGDMHPYPSAVKPGQHLDINLPVCATTANEKLCRSTEVGYHTDIATTGHRGVSEAVRSPYTLRLVLEHFRRGQPRTDLYTIVAQDCGDFQNGGVEPQTSDFGFYDCNWNPHPVAHALHNFTTTLGEGSTDLEPLAVTVDQGPSDSYEPVILRRADGKYILILWRNVSIWNRDTKTPINVSGSGYKLTLPDAESVSLVRPVDSATETPLTMNGDQVDVNAVAGAPVMLVVTPEQRNLMAKPTSKSALKTRLNALKTELDELQAGAKELAGTAPNEAEGLSRACREMRKTLDRVISQGFVAKL